MQKNVVLRTSLMSGSDDEIAVGNDAQSEGDVRCFDRRTPVVVTTALGLLGYQVPQVCDLMVQHWLDTVHAFLSHDCLTAPKLRRILDDMDLVLRDLKGRPLLDLIEALLQAAVRMKNMTPLGSRTFVRTEGGDAAWAIEKILDYVLKEGEFLYNHLSPTARLQVWRLRPSQLKADLSDLAKEAMHRPLLSLEVGSRTMVASLALAPDLLNEVRRLLLMWSSSVRAVRLLELRAQITVAVLQHSTAAGFDEAGWLHTMLRPFLQLLVGVPTVAALSHLVELMDRRESNKESEVYKIERSPKRQRRSYAATDEDESLDDSSSNMPDLLQAGKQAAKNNAPLATDISEDYPIWTLLADFIPWSTFASQLLFQDRDVSPVSRQSAADFLGWLICPSSSEGRASASSEFLHAAEDWQSLCDEETQVGSAGRLLHRRREAVCNLCGSPLNGTGDLVNGVSTSSASQNLVAWLLRICKLQQGCDVDGMWKVIRIFPIATLSSSFLVPEVGGLLLCMILLGFTKEIPSKEKSVSPRSCCTECEDFHCVSCCFKDRHKSSEPPHRTEQIKDDARIQEDLYWAPYAAALLTYLDTNSFAQPQPDSRVIVGRVVAACVRHWVQLSHNVDTVYYNRRIQMLEDLYTRLVSWLDANGAHFDLALTVGNLKLQIEQFKALL